MSHKSSDATSKEFSGATSEAASQRLKEDDELSSIPIPSKLSGYAGIIQTASGRLLDLTSKDLHENLLMIDIFSGMNGRDRWQSQHQAPYIWSVTHHVMAGYYAITDPQPAPTISFPHKLRNDKNFAKYWLLHDATEAFIGDLPGPVKVLLPDYVELENHIWRHIVKAFDVEVNSEIAAWNKYLDSHMLVAEALSLFEFGPAKNWTNKLSLEEPFLRRCCAVIENVKNWEPNQVFKNFTEAWRWCTSDSSVSAYTLHNTGATDGEDRQHH